MKAAVYQSPGAPDVLRYKDVANPRCPTNGVLIKVEAISVEGGDLTNRASGPPRLCWTPEGSSDTRPQARSSLSALTCVIGSSDKKVTSFDMHGSACVAASRRIGQNLDHT